MKTLADLQGSNWWRRATANGATAPQLVVHAGRLKLTFLDKDSRRHYRNVNGPIPVGTPVVQYPRRGHATTYEQLPVTAPSVIAPEPS